MPNTPAAGDDLRDAVGDALMPHFHPHNMECGICGRARRALATAQRDAELLREIADDAMEWDRTLGTVGLRVSADLWNRIRERGKA